MSSRESNKTTANRPPRSIESKVQAAATWGLALAVVLGGGKLALDQFGQLDDQKVVSKTRQEKELRRIVSTTFGKFTEVVCEDLPPKIMGSTVPGTHLIRLDNEQCDILTNYVDGTTDITSPGKRDATVHAVYAITHEYSHREGVINEGTADCFAIQRMGQALIGFGASKLGAYDTGSKFADAYRPANTRYTIPDGCYPNGALDLAIRPGFFPNSK